MNRGLLCRSTAQVGEFVHRTTLSNALLNCGSHGRVERGMLLRKESNKESRCIFHKYETRKTWKTWEMVLWSNEANIQLVCIQTPQLSYSGVESVLTLDLLFTDALHPM